MFLATTPIEELWDFDSKLLFLGPWCLLREKNKRLFKGKDYIIVSSPWKPTVKIKEAADYCNRVYEGILPQLSDNLNSIHQVSYPLKYWRVLVGPWLLQFIEAFYDRYKRIEKALELFPDFYTYVLPRKQCNLFSFDTHSFRCERNEDYYNLKLFSLVAYDLCPNNIITKDYKPEYKMQMHIKRYSWKKRLFNRLIKSLDLFFKCPIVLCDMYHLSLSDIVLLKFKGRLKTLSFIEFGSINESSLKNSYSHNIRNSIGLKESHNKFQSLLYRTIPEAIPMCYIENYRFYKDSVKNIKSIESVRIVGSAVGWFFNERFKFFAAEAILKGANLIEFQHGGGYGVALAGPREQLSLEKDIFYTWGWSSKKHNKIKPLPSPHLSKLKNTHRPRIDNILFVGTNMPKYHYRFHTFPLPEDMPKYFEDKKIFFQALPEEIRNKVFYRPYPRKRGWGEAEVVKQVCPNAKIVSKSRLVKWMQKVRLVVIDHSFTSFIEALSINVPCIFYWDHRVFLMRDEAEKYFSLLRDAGILFKDPLSAAQKVKDVFDNPMQWWLNSAVQNARIQFCSRYAYDRRDWAKIWMRELKHLIYSRRDCDRGSYANC